VELIKDYDCVIDYHSGKANVVADALSRKEKVVVDDLGNKEQDGFAAKCGSRRVNTSSSKNSIDASR
jgi:hypothetical protein